MPIHIIPRSAWGARPPRSRTPTTWAGSTLWVHHSAGPAPAATVAAERQWMRDIQAYHMSQGWADIGYHFVAMPSGRIYEGRGHGVAGAHCPGHNTEPGVCVPGTWTAQRPPDAALASVLALARHLGMTTLRGHREGYPTTCPGDAFQRWVGEHRTVPRRSPPVIDLRGLNTRTYIRVDINPLIGKRRSWVGWPACAPVLRSIAKNGLRTQRCAIAWRGPGRTVTGVWRGPTKVRNVARTLVRTYL